MSDQIDPDEVVFSATDLARLLSVSERHIWTLKAKGKLPRHVRLGSSVRWVKKDIERWLAAGCPAEDQWTVMKGGDQ